jgi:hypothetical protein
MWCSYYIFQDKPWVWTISLEKNCKLKENSNITDWGWNEYNKLGSLVRNYFVKKEMDTFIC